MSSSPIFRWRRRFNQTRRHLSEHVGIAVRRIYEYESGRVLARPETVARLSVALGASPWRLAAEVFHHHYEGTGRAVGLEGTLTPAFLEHGAPGVEYVTAAISHAALDPRALERMAVPVLRQLALA